MHELTKSYPTAVLPVLTYLFHRLDQRFGKAPTLLILDEGWLFLDDPVFAPKIREWLKTLAQERRSTWCSPAKASRTWPTVPSWKRSRSPATPRSICRMPPPWTTRRSMSFYRSFGLNDQQSRDHCRAPRRNASTTSRRPLGNRLFSLASRVRLGLAYCAATNNDDQALLADRWARAPHGRRSMRLT